MRNKCIFQSSTTICSGFILLTKIFSSSVWVFSEWIHCIISVIHAVTMLQFCRIIIRYYWHLMLTLDKPLVNVQLLLHVNLTIFWRFLSIFIYFYPSKKGHSMDRIRINKPIYKAWLYYLILVMIWVHV